MARVARSLAAVLLAPRTHPRLGARVPQSRARLVSTSSSSAVNPDDDDDDVRSADVAVPVLIVGAGPVGLTLSALLSRFGVDHLVCERRARPSTHPQAHFVNNRTMEIFRPMLGLGASIARSQPPLEHWRRFVYCTGMARGVELGRVDHFDDGTHDPPTTTTIDIIESGPASVAPLWATSSSPRCSTRVRASPERTRRVHHRHSHRRRPVPPRGARWVRGEPGDGAPGARGIQPRRRSQRLDDVVEPTSHRRGRTNSRSAKIGPGANDGYPAMQHLVNVHFVPNPRGARRDDRAAMLYLSSTQAYWQ